MAADAKGAVLVLGGTGMLGQAMVGEAERRGLNVVRAARGGAEIVLDLASDASIDALLAQSNFDLVVNAAGIASVDICEKDPCLAYRVNARAVDRLVGARRNWRFVHISTDHFFCGDGPGLHDENAEVAIVNEYARTKYAAEAFALRDPETLVARTNVTGARNQLNSPTFAESIIDSLIHRKPIRTFGDFFTSTIDAGACARAVFDLVDRDARGLINVASRECCSKEAFIHSLAREMNITLDWATKGSVNELAVRRADSLGLDVSRAERTLGYRLPELAAVARSLVRELKPI